MPQGVAITLLKKRRFVQEYLRDLNATQAGIRIGFTPSSAPSWF
jgi:phage terminase small subunit